MMHRTHSSALDFSKDLFSRLDVHWVDGKGMHRPTYSSQEEEAAQIIAQAGQSLGLRCLVDAAGNYYLFLEGDNPDLPAIVSGSHVDAVPHGGRYDGTAGIVCALAAIKAIVDEGKRPAQSVCVVVLRGEESAWFGQVSIGSKLAAGTLNLEQLERLEHRETGQSLGECMEALSYPAAALKTAKFPLFPLQQTACFVEAHIEQGPVLEAHHTPLGIVTGIRGNIRYLRIVCTGEAGHTGTMPEELRKDAVRACARLIVALEERFLALREKEDIVFTFPIARTSAEASMTTVPDRFELALEVRGLSETLLRKVPEMLAEALKDVGVMYNVSFAASDPIFSKPALMNDQVRQQLAAAAEACGLSYLSLPSGAGHDSSVFANVGVPCGMVFMRHSGISHRRDEDMPLDYFVAARELLQKFFMNGYNSSKEIRNKSGFVEYLLEHGARQIQP
ncbi:MAG: hydantoinase/carbamoylase family amidase [Alphaproteobacteria bacterium]|nr:hydantoinase/carbamoylase family amidase [Alphaproteobacteria bacterium]